MKTFKKLFAYSAIFALLATMMPTYANAASYDAELTEAYAYAKNKGITTMTSIDNADMYGNLTRVAMAKMVANYVLDLGLQELDTDKECNFPDVSASLDEAYDNGVTKACQLGLMGVGIEKFNPNGIVTRAEFGTVLSRALWGDEYNDATPYYKDHLQALKDEGIMNIIDNPNMKEVRGYVMLMMMRADDAYTPTTGCSAEEFLACILADDYESCIAACSEDAEEEVVLPGHATVSLVSKAAEQTVPYDAVNVKVGTIKLTAGENNTRVSSVEIARDGLADLSTASGDNRPRVYLKGGNVKTTAKAVSSNTNSVVVKFSPALDMKAGSSMSFDVMVSMLETAKAVNSTHNFKVLDVVVANGKSTGTPISLGTIKTTSAKSKTVDVIVKNGDTTAKAGDRKTIAKVEVVFDAAAGTLKGFSLSGTTLSGATATNENLYDIFANAKAYINDAEVGSVFLAKDKVIVEGLDKSVAKDGKVTIEVKSDIVYSKQRVEVKFGLEDIDALEGNFGFGMRGATDKVASIIVDGSDITFKKVSIEKDVLPGTTQVKLFAGEVKTATDVVVQQVKITPAHSNTGDFEDLLSKGSAVLKINGESFALEDTDIVNNTYFDVSSMEAGIDAGTTAKVEVIVNTKVPATINPVTSQLTVELSVVESADDSAVKYTVPSRPGDTVKFAAGDIKVNKATVAGLATRSLFANKEQEIGRFSIKANNDIATIKSFDIVSSGSTLNSTGLEDLFDGNLSIINVDNDEDLGGTITLSGEKFEVKGLGVSLDKNETINIKIVANLGSVKNYYESGLNLYIENVVASTSINDPASPDALALDLYTIRVTAPEILLTKHSENMFQVVIKNIDADADVDVEELRFRVRALASENNFAGTVCLTEDVRLTECGGSHNFGAWGTGLDKVEIGNGNEITRYILVDGAFIEPDVLQAQVSSLKYAEKSSTTKAENYSVSAQ